MWTEPSPPPQPTTANISRVFSHVPNAPPVPCAVVLGRYSGGAPFAMNTPLRITLTGLDEFTEIDRAAELTLRFPSVEWGILYSASPDGRNRYPSLPWIRSAAERLSGNCALHICGSLARAQLFNGELSDILRHAPRVQINGRVHEAELATICETFANIFITQHGQSNPSLWCALRGVRNHAVLIDGSGGRGISPSKWVRPATWKDCGFAGGLGPDNITRELSAIQAVAQGGWWIDMEGKLRENDTFSLSCAERVLEMATA